MIYQIALNDLESLVQDHLEISGNKDVILNGIASLELAKKGDLSFVQSKKYVMKAKQCEASALIVPNHLDAEFPSTELIIRAENPTRVMSQICSGLENRLFPRPVGDISPHAVIADSVELAETVSVGHFTTVSEGAVISEGSCLSNNVSVGKESQIGKHVFIGDNVTLAPYTIVGDYSRIYSGAVIGAPGFGYEFDPQTGAHEPVPQIGRVRIGTYVDIGANTAIDRARFGETVIGDGTKIDNLVQIAHNVRIGKHCILCGQVGISGSVKVGDYVVFGGRAGVSDHVEIASKTQFGGGTAVGASITEEGKKFWGVPAMDYGLAMKIAVLQRKLPELFKRMKDLENTLENQT